MLLTLTTTHVPATDLGYVLEKNPASVTTRPLNFGTASVYWSEASETRATAVLQIEVDPVALVRGRSEQDTGPLDAYVNDRGYAASSFLSVAIGQLFRSAMNTTSRARPELSEASIPLEATVYAAPARGGDALVRRLFEPLGWEVELVGGVLDEAFPAWGDSPYRQLTLRGTARVRDLLRQLYVLLPVLDDDKHYWIGKDEVDKLLARGDGWLDAHPDRDLITRRYLRRSRGLIDDALARLEPEAPPADDAADNAAEQELESPTPEAAPERKARLVDERLEAVMAVVAAAAPERVVDLGCGEGRFVRALLKDRRIKKVVGVDVSPATLAVAADRLKLDRMNERERARIELLQGSLVYRDARIEGFDLALCVEVIEHVDLDRLSFVTHNLFHRIRPKTLIVTTPNAEYNVRYAGMQPGAFRHRDHRFEWDRATFQAWLTAAEGYDVELLPIGPVDDEVGPPTQMAVLRRRDA